MIFGVNIVSSGLLWGALSLYLRRRVILPIQDLTGSVKSMTETDLKSWQSIPPHALTAQSDELEILSQAFRNMGQQLDELVDNLEDKVKERTAAIVLEKQKTQEILNNIGVGIITFNDSLLVGDEYSRHMHALLDLTPAQIRGVSFTELILDRLNLSADGRQTVHEILRGSLGMAPLSWEMNHGNLPSSMVVTVHGTQRYMSLDWYPMLNEAGLVERGMLVIKDQTEKVLLQQDLEKSNERHECLSEIINVAMKYDMGYVLRFVDRAQKQLNANGMNRLMGLAHTKPEELFILLHTLKGDARTTGFKRIATKAHQAESILHRIRSKPLESDFISLEAALQQLGDELTEFSELLSHLFNRNGPAQDPSACLINHLLPQFKEVVSILKDNGIKVGGFYYDDRIQNWNPRNIELIKDMIMHALTNSIDHGYVLPKLAGEPTVECAKLHVKADFEDDNVVIEIIDEGHGYDLEKIREKYKIERSVSDKDTLATLLESGVTTTSEITTLSGRGVGLNAIKELSSRLGGVTQLEPNYPRGAKVRITLPRHEVVITEEFKQVG
jgi:HPt (histidine-containing phosphotransfer) domain-containing protein